MATFAPIDSSYTVPAVASPSGAFGVTAGGSAAPLSFAPAFTDPGNQITYMAGAMGSETLQDVINTVSLQYSFTPEQKDALTRQLLSQMSRLGSPASQVTFDVASQRALSIALPEGAVFNPAWQHQLTAAQIATPVVEGVGGVQVRAQNVSVGTTLGDLWARAQELDPSFDRDSFLMLNASRFVASAHTMTDDQLLQALNALTNTSTVRSAGLAYLSTPTLELPAVQSAANLPNTAEKQTAFIAEGLRLTGRELPQAAYNALMSGELTLSMLIGGGVSYAVANYATAAEAAPVAGLWLGSALGGALLGLLKNVNECHTEAQVKAYAAYITGNGRGSGRLLAHVIAGGLGAAGYRAAPGLLADAVAARTAAGGTTAATTTTTAAAARTVPAGLADDLVRGADDVYVVADDMAATAAPRPGYVVVPGAGGVPVTPAGAPGTTATTAGAAGVRMNPTARYHPTNDTGGGVPSPVAPNSAGDGHTGINPRMTAFPVPDGHVEIASHLPRVFNGQIKPSFYPPSNVPYYLQEQAVENFKNAQIIPNSHTSLGATEDVGSSYVEYTATDEMGSRFLYRAHIRPDGSVDVYFINHVRSAGATAARLAEIGDIAPSLPSSTWVLPTVSKFVDFSGYGYARDVALEVFGHASMIEGSLKSDRWVSDPSIAASAKYMAVAPTTGTFIYEARFFRGGGLEVECVGFSPAGYTVGDRAADLFNPRLTAVKPRLIVGDRPVEVSFLPTTRVDNKLDPYYLGNLRYTIAFLYNNSAGLNVSAEHPSATVVVPYRKDYYKVHLVYSGNDIIHIDDVRKFTMPKLPDRLHAYQDRFERHEFLASDDRFVLSDFFKENFKENFPIGISASELRDYITEYADSSEILSDLTLELSPSIEAYFYRAHIAGVSKEWAMTFLPDGLTDAASRLGIDIDALWNAYLSY